MRKDQIFVLLLVLLLPMTGCFGDVVGDAQADDDDDQPAWVNNVGTDVVNWSLSLNNNQWLEVKSAYVLVGHTSTMNNESQTPILEQIGMIVQEDSNWILSSDSHSPIFGGNYHLCAFYDDGVCFDSHPSASYSVVEYSIIYRIHSV